jgi:hypothetical protein
MLARPTFRNLTESYESWAYRNGLMRQLTTLEQQQVLERDAIAADDRLYRLTAQGRLHVLGGRDPEAQWARPWDGQWRLVLFDVPTGQNAQRERLRRYLRDKGFGYLQNSVWISPDPLVEERESLGGGKINLESLLLLEARPCAGESDAEIVAGAWDFERINRRYARHLKVLAERPGGEGVAALGDGGARGVAGRGDERSAAAGPDSAVRLPGATGVAAAGGGAPGRQPATAHVQTRKNRGRPRVT